jgi:SAM-dependent methyltransferase/ribosomal protein S27E
MKEEEIRKRDVFNKYLSLVEEDVKDFFDFNSFIKTTCPACGSDDYNDEIVKSGFTYVTCQKCSTLFINPRPPFSVLKEFYSNSPSTSYWVNEFFMPTVEARREKIFKPRAQYLNETFSKNERKIVGDIGAGFGLFLEELKKISPEEKYIAIEPSIEMAGICKKKGIEVIESVLEEVQDHDNTFDVLTAFELFEHLYNPQEFLIKCRSLLKKGGRLVFTTLNGKGFDISVLWENSKSISPPHHLNFFNPYSVQLLLEKCNFEIVDVSTPGKLDWDIVEGMIKNENVNAGHFWNSLAYSNDIESKIKLQNWISESKLSSHMRVIARRKY